MKWWHIAGAAAAVYVSYKVGCRMGIAKAVQKCGCESLGIKPAAMPGPAGAGSVMTSAEIREPSPDAIRAAGL